MAIVSNSVRLVLMALFVLALITRGSQVVQAQDATSTFKAKCALCHGADGKGNTPVGKKMGIPDFTSPDVQKRPDSDLIQIVSKGKNKMPSYDGKLKPEEIKSLVAYIRQLGNGK